MRGRSYGFKGLSQDPLPGLRKLYWWGQTAASPLLTQTEVRNRIRAMPRGGPAPLIVLDIEDRRFPVDIRSSGKPAVDRTINYLRNVADWVHQANPEARIGFYGIIFGDEHQVVPKYLAPYRQWNPAWRDNGQGPRNYSAIRRKYEELVEANRYLMPIVAKADVLVPAFYTFRQNPFQADVAGNTSPSDLSLADNGWYAQIDGYLTMVRGDLALTKTLCPFIWPQYHSIAPISIRGKYLPLSLWRQQVNFVRYRTECAILFGVGQSPPQTVASFSPWLNIVLNARRRRDVTPPTPPTNLVVHSRVRTVSDLSSIVLGWNKSFDSADGSGVDGYQIYRDGISILKTPATSYRDADKLIPGQHVYWIVGVDLAGNLSAPSNRAAVYVR